ncbi:MAG: SH3 domain-containing protein [Rhodobacteraceae bacterium]|nr:SH3 domain-containing protein [Paracoccaceae bacterium]
MRYLTALIGAALLALAIAPGAMAGDCTGFVIKVRPLNQYNHAAGNGFLAVRSGPGTGYNQVGELYLGDEFWVAERRGNWVYVGCMSGRCENPLWGPAYAEGWSYAKYLSYGGVCP